jgi:hypothetical protein
MSETRAPGSRAHFTFRGRVVELFFLRMLHLVCSLAMLVCAAATLLILLGRPPDLRLPDPVEPALDLSPFVPGAAAVVLLFVTGALGRAVKLYRIRHTVVYGRRLDYREGCASFFHALANSFLVIVTFGLGGPWVRARSIRHKWHCSFYRDDPSQHLDHDGPVGACYLHTLLWLVALPLIPATLGLLAFPLAHLGVKWEQGHILVPAPDGTRRRARYTGTAGGYMGTCLPGALLTVLTLGLYWPWATFARWRWIAAHTELPDVRPAAVERGPEPVGPAAMAEVADLAYVDPDDVAPGG